MPRPADHPRSTPAAPSAAGLTAWLAAQLDPVRRAIRQVRKSGASVRSVHRLRSSARRAEAAADAIADLLSASDLTTLRAQLRKARRRAGKVRDLDVIASQIAALPARGVLAQSQRRCLKRVQTKRDRAAAKLIDWTSSKPERELVACPDAATLAPASAADCFLAGVARSVDRARAAVGELDDSPQSLHAVRKMLKQVRYALDHVARARAFRRAGILADQVKALTESAGLANDGHVLCDYLAAMRKNQHASQLLPLAERRHARRHTRALTLVRVRVNDLLDSIAAIETSEPKVRAPRRTAAASRPPARC